MGRGTLTMIGACSRTRAARLSTVFALVLASAFLAALAFGPAPASAQESKRILLYTGTTGYRHADAIDQGAPVVKTALEAAGYTVDREDCDNNGGGANNCDNANKNPRVFTDANLAKYDAILLFNASSSWAGGGRPGPLWNADQRAAIIRFVQGGGGIAANHNATDMGANTVTWDWWDGGPNSAVGSLMKGHGATSTGNVAQVEVADHHHLSTKDLPDKYGFGDEHYNFARSVRGTHHVLATLDERTYTPGNPMGQDHPITWCKLYDGAAVEDGTGTPKPYNDGRVWVTGMGHFGSSYTQNGGNNEIVKQIVGGVRWAAGEGKKSDCSGTVWSSFKRTTLVDNVNGPIGLDIAPDGKVYWSEIGPAQGYESQGFIKMHDPTGPGNNKTTVATIPTRADHGNSEDGVLGMSLEPGFDLTDPAKRDVFVYYSPRNPAWPTTGNQIVVGYNQVSRFTINAEGTAVVPGSERVILRVPKAKISGSPSGFAGGPTDSGPGHVGGAGLDFDSEGNLYLGVGDDVSPNAGGHNRYAPMDYRAAERWDARKTSANSADLRGKILRIRPKDEIPAGATPDVGTTYDIPAGNMFPTGMAKTRPEIYAMGFRQPFTIHTDAANPGNVVVGEYCHDNQTDGPKRAPAGVCEWNLVEGPSFQGWPFCMGDNSTANTSWRWDYAGNATTDSQYDCSQSQLPSDIRWAPAGQTAAQPTHDGLDTIPGPATPATIWRKYPGLEGQPANAGLQSPADFGDLSAGGASPITGPVYRYDADTAKPGAFPPYYDGSWFIANRGTEGGFWKEVRLREDNGKMLRVNDWVSPGQSPNNSFVIPTQFGPDGALYMARWSEGCCRNQLNSGTQTQLVKIEFAVADECLEDTEPPNINHSLAGRLQPGETTKYLQAATLSLVAGDAGCAGVDTVEYRVGGAGDWQPYTAPVEFDAVGDYSVEYRATDEFDNVSTVKTATFSVVEVDDDATPTVTHTLAGERTDEGHYLAPATLTIRATDDLSPISSIEYRVDQDGDWNKTEYTGVDLVQQLQASIGEHGFHYVEFRATDKAGNTSAIQGVPFAVVTACTPATDEFTGTALDGRWLRHRRNGGTPLTGEMAPTLGGGKLTMKTNNFEIDSGNGTTSVGPINFIGQDLAALGNGWEVETEFTVTHTGGWQGVGLMLWRADNNFFRSTITHSLGNGTIYVEQSKDNPTTAEGSRVQAGSNVQILPAKGPVTIRMRYARAAGSDTVTAQYRVTAPESAANPDWVNFGGAANFLDLNPAGGPRRDSVGSRIGIYAGGNFPGSTGNHPYSGTPANVDVEYFRVTPDETSTCPNPDVAPPETSATLDPAQPGPGGTYNVPVEVDFSATDEGGVARTEYSIDDGPWVPVQNDGGADPFTSSVKVTQEGEHTARFRSRDEAGNLEVPKEVSFTIANIRDVFASGTTWVPDELSVDFGETVTWHFDEPAAGFPHDLWLVPPDAGMFQVTNGAVMPGGAPVDYTFRKAGSWTFVCTLHSGMSGTVKVGEEQKPDPDPDPDPTPGGTGNPPAGNGPGTDPLPNPLPTATAAKLGKLPKTKLASFLKKGLKVTSACESGLRGKIGIKLSKREARKLGLKKATTLVTKTVTCGANDTVAVRLKPSKKLKKALKKARRSLTATVKITMGSGSAATSSSRPLVLSAPKKGN
jgi:plastocyanin